MTSWPWPGSPRLASRGTITVRLRCITELIIRTCEGAINKLEAVDDITDKYNIEFVKVNNKKYARSLGIR